MPETLMTKWQMHARVLDWDAQFACALDPETAKAIRDDRLPGR